MKKTAHYRRAVWFSESPQPLSTVLKNCFQNTPESVAPVYPFGTESCVVAKRSINTGPIFLHLVTYEGGAPAAVIVEATDTGSWEADTEEPPDGREFIRSQLFCLVRGNDVVWTAHNGTLRDGPINALLHGLINNVPSEAGDTMFELQAKLDKEAFEQAFKLGIAEIDLGVGDFKPTLEALLSKNGIACLNPLRSIIYNDPSAEEVEAASDVQAKLVLKPGRRWDKPHVKELLSNMASSVVDNHEDEFVIVTKNGMRLTRRKMSVHKEYDAVGNRQILNATDVHAKLVSILNDLDEAGILE
ncbi:MAG: hypothetical protein Kow0032_22790 [Methyloligellaceae bacterium]